MKQTIINNITGERHQLKINIEPEQLKATWQYSTDFPICVDRGISTENLTFYKEDADFLRKIYDKYGTSANVSLKFEDKKIDFSLLLDFSSVQFYDVKFSVGYKFTSLPDKIKDWDNIGEFSFDENELSKYSLFSDVVTTFRAKKDYIPLHVSFKTAEPKKLYVLAENINELETEMSPSGYSYNQPISLPSEQPEVYGGTDCLFVQNSPTSLITWMPATAEETKYAPAYIDYSCDFWLDAAFISFRKRGLPSDVQMSLTLHVAREVVNGNASTFTDIDSITTSQIIDLNDKSMNLIKSGTFTFSEKKSLQIPIAEEYSEKMIYYHMYFTFKILANSFNVEFNLDASRNNRYFGSFSIKNFNLTHNLTNINRSSQNLLSINRFFEKINEKEPIFENRAENILEKCYITSNSLMGDASKPLKVKLTDIMHDLSLLYGLKFVETDGRYVIMPITEGTPIHAIKEAANVTFDGLETYNEIKVGNPELPANRYNDQIFYGIARTEGFSGQIRNTYDLKTSLMTSGDEIFNELLTGNDKDKPFLLHVEDGYNVVNSDQHRKINEYYSVRGILQRIGAYLFSFVKPSGMLEIDKITPTFNVTLEEAEDDDINTHAFIGVVSESRTAQMTSTLFRHYSISCDIPADFETISKLLNETKRLKICDLVVTATKIELNLAPKTINVVGYIEN